MLSAPPAHQQRAAPSGYQVLKMAHPGAAPACWGERTSVPWKQASAQTFSWWTPAVWNWPVPERAPPTCWPPWACGARWIPPWSMAAWWSGKASFVPWTKQKRHSRPARAAGHICPAEQKEEAANAASSFLIQHLNRGAQNPVSNIDAQRSINLPLPDMVICRKSRRKLLAQSLQILRRAAVSDSQIVAAV